MTWKAQSPSALTGSNCKLFTSRVPKWTRMLAKHMQCMESKPQRGTMLWYVTVTWETVHKGKGNVQGCGLYSAARRMQKTHQCSATLQAEPVNIKAKKIGIAGESCKLYSAGPKALTALPTERWATWEQTAATKTDTEYKFCTQCELNTLAVNLKTSQHVEVTWNHNVQRDWKSP